VTISELNSRDDTVLVVDDDPDILAFLSKSIATRYTVMTATSGMEALTLVSEKNILAVVTDQKMPGMTGVQLARAIHRQRPELSVVLLTAYRDPADVVEAINEGEVFRYVSKPFHTSELLLTLKIAIERTRLAGENHRLVEILNKQLSAITLVGEVGRDVGPTGTSYDLFTRLLQRLPDVIDFDLASVVCEREDPVTSERLMHIHCAVGATHADLLQVRDRSLSLYTGLTGRSLTIAETIVHVSGDEEVLGQENALVSELHELCVPLTVHGGRNGVLILFSRPRNYDYDEVRLLEVLATETSTLLHQQQEVVLKERRDFAALMSAVGDGVIIAKLDGTVSLCNAAARQMLLLTNDEIPAAHLIWPTLAFSPRDAVKQFADQEFASIHFMSQIKERVLVGVALPIFDKQKRLIQMAVILRDAKNDRLANHVHDLPIKRERICLDELLDKAMISVGALFAEKQLKIERRRNLETVECVGSETALLAVVSELFARAIALANRESTIMIETGRVMVSPSFVVFSIHSQGGELTVDARKQFAEKFAKEYCVGIQSADDKGTMFTLVLSTRGNVTPISFSNMINYRGKRVLVMSDGPYFGRFMNALLHNEGCEIEVAKRGDQALACARTQHLDAIFAAVEMNEIDGLSLISTLKHDPATRQVPVIAFGASDRAKSARRAGASAYLEIPLEPQQIAESLRAAFEQNSANKKPVILVVDEDSQSRRATVQELRNLSYQVVEGMDFAQAQKILDEQHIDMMLLDLGISADKQLTRFEVWRENHATLATVTLLMSARAQTAEKIRAFRAGADDYLIKPLNPLELAARVENALRRRERTIATSPTTHLPGSHSIEIEIQSRIAQQEPFLLCYFDIDNLKAFNDIYGYAKADAVVLQTGDILREIVARHGSSRDFIGHIAGDDFVCAFTLENGEKLCRQVIRSFDKIIPLYYDSQDRKRGFIAADDRYGAPREFPIMSISVAVILVPANSLASYASLAVKAAEIKKLAKAKPGSTLMMSENDRTTQVQDLDDHLPEQRLS